MPATGPPRRRRALIALAVLVPMAGLLGWIYLTLRPVEPTDEPFPVPNGYDDVVAAGGLIQPVWPAGGDLDKATPEERRSFVLANRAALDRGRLGLGREARVRMVDSPQGLAAHLTEVNQLRLLSRLLIGESDVLKAEGKVAESARVDLDVLRLGQASTQGGMLLDVIQGWVIQGQAVARLRLKRDALSPGECRPLIREIETLDKRRVTLPDIFKREDRYVAHSFDTFQRTLMDWQGVTAASRQQVKPTIEKLRGRTERSVRSLLLGLAIHSYHEDHKTWPKDLADLVPGELSALPIDSATGKPLEAPRSSTGELVVEVAKPARP